MKNPVRSVLVRKAKHYKYNSAIVDYTNKKGFVNIE